MRYDTQNPADVDEVGTWIFVETNKIAPITLSLTNDLQGVLDNFGSHIQGNKVYLSARSIVSTSTDIDHYRFAFEMTADETPVVSKVVGDSVYHLFTGVFNTYWDLGQAVDDELIVHFTCYRQNYWYTQEMIPSAIRYASINAVFMLKTNWYSTPQPEATNTWRKTGLADAAVAGRVNNWGRTK
jgi:hypothetical protein